MEGHSNGDSLANDWRTQHEPDLREKVIRAIVEKLRKCFPRSTHDISKTAITFENKIYGMAKDKGDYLRKIHEKIFAFDKKLRACSSANEAHTPDPAQGQSLPTSLPLTQTSTSQQWVTQTNIQNKLNVPHSSGFPTQAPTTVSAAHNLNIQMGEGVHSNLLPSPQRQIQGRQPILAQPPQNLQQQHDFQSLSKQPMPHHRSLSTTQHSFPQSCALSSLPLSGQQNSQFLPRHQIQKQPVHSSHQLQMAVQHLDDTQRFQATDSLHQIQNLADQQNQPCQLQRAHPTNPSTSQDSTGRTFNTSGGDWREETYQKIKALKEKHILELTSVYPRLSDKLRQIDSLPQQNLPHERVKALRTAKAMLEQVLVFLNVSRSSVSEKHRDRFSQYEAQLLRFIKPQRVMQQQQVHLPPPQNHQTALQSQSGQVHVSQTAVPHSSQTRPRIEPTDENKIVSSSENVVVHSLKQNALKQLLQQQQQQQPSASSPQMQNYSSPQLVKQQTLPTPLNKTESQEHPLVTLPPEPVSERPIDRLIKAIQSSSPESLAQSVNEMSSVISLTDRFAGSVHTIGGSRARLAQDLSERTRLRSQQRDTNPTKRFKRSITAMPFDITSQNDSSYKIEPGYALLQEITEINGRLLETVVSICNEDVRPGTVVTCSYVPVALSATFKALYNSGDISQIQPLRLIVPENYPYAPIIVEKVLFDDSVHKYEDLSTRARSRFGLSMGEYSKPMSLKDIAQVWDESARATVVEYAERHGGGTFSSKYGRWESVLRAS